MKSKILIISVWVFSACNESGYSKLKIEGIYVSSYESEFGKAMDTIIIAPLNRGMFYLVRRVGYRRIVNGKQGAYEHSTDSSICSFNETTAQLQEQRHGRVYALARGGKELVMGGSAYKRIQ